jgi:NTP pyrophosphatase (non-canonical NTP hydrolase)
MDMDEYQQRTAMTAIYPHQGTGRAAAINYTILGLVGEAGEIPNKWKKYFRDDVDLDDVKKTIGAELGDALWYLSQLCTELGITLEELAQSNLDKLSSRKERGVLSGSGDDR